MYSLTIFGESLAHFRPKSLVTTGGSIAEKTERDEGFSSAGRGAGKDRIDELDTTYVFKGSREKEDWRKGLRGQPQQP